MKLYARKVVLASEAGNIERAQPGKEYPAGTYIIPLSGVNRAVCEVLMEPREINSRFACITFKDDMHPHYLAAIMDREIDRFLTRYATGINLQMDALQKYFKVEIHTDKATRDAIGEMQRKAQEAIEYEKKVIELNKECKKYMLSNMFPD